MNGDFLLRSGQRADTYFDKYQFEADPAILRSVGVHLAELVPSGVELLAGLELGGVPVATALSLETGTPAVFVRKEAKAYGTAKLAEGPDIAERRLVVVEDVVTSGGQILRSVADLRLRGAEIDTAVCVIDREQGGSEALAEIGVALQSLFTRSELEPE